MKRGVSVVPTKLAHFTEEIVPVAQKAVAGVPALAVSKGESGYADWVIISIHALREYLDQPYRRLMKILYEMPRVTGILGLYPAEYPTSRRSMGTNRNSKWGSGERSSG